MHLIGYVIAIEVAWYGLKLDPLELLSCLLELFNFIHLLTHRRSHVASLQLYFNTIEVLHIRSRLLRLVSSINRDVHFLFPRHRFINVLHFAHHFLVIIESISHSCRRTFASHAPHRLFKESDEDHLEVLEVVWVLHLGQDVLHIKDRDCSLLGQGWQRRSVIR